MTKLILAISGALLACNMAFAADMSCADKAKEKKLSGAAETRFIKQCEKDAMAPAQNSCSVQAKQKKLSGAAKKSFMTKCTKEAKAMN